MNRSRYFALLALPLLLSACDQLGIETPAVTAARSEAEGKAVGGACRHAGRALEDCYSMNKKASKAAVYAGWREMDGYMRENRIDVVRPEDESSPPPKSEAASEGSAKDKPADKTAEKTSDGGEAQSKSTAPVAKPKIDAAKPHKTSAIKPGVIQA